ILSPSGEKMGGLELITESLAIDPLRPIIVITGYGSIELARKTLTQGVFDFIEKSANAINDLVEAVQRAIEQRNAKVKRAGNPFARMTGMEPTFFGGRALELQFFEEKLNRAIQTRFCEHFIVLGNWGIGKSTLLREYKKICHSRGYIAAIVPLEPLRPQTALIEGVKSIIEGVLRDIPYTTDRLRELTKYFDSVGISILGTGLQLGRSTTGKEVPAQALLHDTLIKLWEDLQTKVEVLVIMLDDLENFIELQDILMLLKQTLLMDSMRKTKILFGIASTPDIWTKITSQKKHHPLSRYFISRTELTSLSENELKDVIQKSLVGTGISFSREVANKVFEITQGHPFEMQVLCYHLFNNQMSGRVEEDVWDNAVRAALIDIGMAVFDQWYFQASNEESKVLYILARHGNSMTVKEITDVSKSERIKISDKNITKYLQRLVNKELITKSQRGRYNISDAMFKAYLRSRESKL
ncbi:MAG: AAA family ATPase, partial [Candidatus Zixiibacteriota bacterium]